MGVANILADRVLVTTQTTGTGTYSLGNAASDGFFSPAEVTPSLNGARVSYAVVDSLTAPTAVELGEGVLASGVPWTLTRATIRRSKQGGLAGAAAINWAVGTRYVYITPLAANTPQLDTDGWLALPSRLSVAGAATLSGDLTINRAWPTVYLNKPASGTASQIFGLSNGVARWILRFGADDAESGGNAGSTFDLLRYSDAGAFVDIPLSISRATGRTTLTDARVGALSVAAGGGEGGEIRLERQPTGSALAADLTLDFAGNALRIFEGGGTVRGAFLDITECAAGVNARLWHSGNFPFVPRPTGATGVGLWTYIQPGSGAPLVLAAGGTWAYFATRRDVVSGAGKDGVGGVAAGGTTVGPAIGGEAWTGFAWRIA